MNISLENLELLPEIKRLLEELNEKIEFNTDKRWLNITETAKYLGYSKDHIHKLKNNEFDLNIHYYKKSGKLLFDKTKLDEWVMSTQTSSFTKELLNSVSLAA
ncbi:DNA-binding protein [Arcobacter sp. YIC-464]|uniref:DNA-binding protein n=1 Tax=Arcobacter sp. YIC-464 TaxID=3376631 RepID=UPI003C270F89